MQKSVQDPRFSIIIPTYNRADMIGGAIQSVLNQSFEDWELIIIDDGSTDDTADVVHGFQDQRIVYIHQENAERSAARNNGIAHAKGAFLCFLDSDDYFENNHLSAFQDLILKHENKTALYVSGCILEDVTSKKRQIFHLPQGGIQKGADFLIHPMASQRVCGHRDVFQNFRFNPKRTIGEDTELWMAIATEFPIINGFFQTVVIVDHLDRTVGLEKESASLRQMELLRDLRERYDEDYLSPQLFQRALASAHFKLAQHYQWAGKGKAMRETLRRIQKIQPGYRKKEGQFMILNSYPLSRMALRMLGKGKTQS